MNTEEIDDILERTAALLDDHSKLFTRLTNVLIQHTNRLDEITSLILYQEEQISALKARISQLESQYNPPPTDDDGGSPG